MSKRDQHSLFLTLDSLVPENHPYRHLDELLSFSELSAPYHSLYSAKGRKEKGVEFGLRTLVLQFMEDLSDREMERYLQENTAGQWFCELALGEKTPDHSYFGDFRKRLGTKRLMDIFSLVQDRLKGMGLIREVFTFVGLSDNSKNRLEGKIFQTKFNTKCFLPIFSVLSPAIGDFHELQTDLS